jgi:O-antigen ligase
MRYSISLPFIAAGYSLLMLLPTLLAAIDVGIGFNASYLFRLSLWNVPWIFGGAIVLVALVIDMYQTGQHPWFLSRRMALLLAGLAIWAMFLGRTVAPDPAQSDLLLMRLALALALGFAAFYGMHLYQARFVQPVYIALLSGVVFIAPFLWYALYAQPENRLLGEGLVWHLPAFGAVRLFGMAMEAGIAVGLGLSVWLGAGRIGFWAALVTVVLWAMLFWSGGRGAVLSLGIGTLLVSLVYRQYFLRLWLLLGLTAALGAALSMLIWTPDALSFGFLNMFLKTTRGGVEEAIGDGRVAHWVGALELIKQNPFRGYGIGQFSNLWPAYAQADAAAQRGFDLGFYFLPYRNVHNILLEIVLSWGLIAGAVALWLLLKAWAHSMFVPAGGGNGAKVPALLGLNALLFHSMVSGPYFFPHSLIYTALFFGICLAPNPARNENTNQ